MNTDTINRLMAIPSDKKERHKLLRQVLASSIAEQVKALRAYRSWTQKELAAKAGLQVQTIIRIERGISLSYSLNSLLKIARACDVGLLCKFPSWGDWLKVYGGGFVEVPKTFTEEFPKLLPPPPSRPR